MSQNVTFSSNQIKAIEWLATDKNQRVPATQEFLADDLGVRRETVSRWKKSPDFIEAVNLRARELLGSDLPQIYAALAREAVKGNFQHIKLAMEMTGEYTPKQEIGLTTIDLSKATDEQLQRIADGEHPAAVMADTSKS